MNETGNNPNDEIANLLIDAGADVNYIEQKEDNFRCPVLNSAIYKGNVGLMISNLISSDKLTQEEIKELRRILEED